MDVFKSEIAEMIPKKKLVRTKVFEQLGRVCRAVVGKFKVSVKCMLRKFGYEIRRNYSPRFGILTTRREGGRLYVGCGSDSRDGFVGCDIRPLPNVSVVCKAWEVSRHRVNVDEIYSRHMLEHLTFEEVNAALEDWYQALKDGGRIHIIVPNLNFHIEQWLRAEWSEKTFGDARSDARWGAAGLYGWQRNCNPKMPDYDNSYWDVHKSGYSVELLRWLLGRVGFEHINVNVKDEVHLVARATKAYKRRAD